MGPERYREIHVLTASPNDLALLLYDRALSLLADAEAAFTDNTPDRFERIANALLRTKDILRELTASLNMERGGEIAQRLAALYDFMLDALSRAVVDHTVEPVREVRQMLGELREALQKAGSSAAFLEGGSVQATAQKGTEA